MKHNLYSANFITEENKRLKKEAKDCAKYISAGLNLFRQSPNLIAPSLEEFSNSNNNAKAPALLILAGGGYFGRDQQKEAIPSAKFFHKKGLKTFILHYRVSPYPFTSAIADAQRAIQFMRFHADNLGINKDKIGVLGYSAGGHIASVIANISYEGKLDDKVSNYSSVPNLHILGYPVIDLHYNSLPLTFVRMMAFPKKKSQNWHHKINSAKLVYEKTPPFFILILR